MVGLAKVLLATSTEQTNLTKLRASVLGFSYDLCVPSGGVEEQQLPKTQKRFRSERCHTCHLTVDTHLRCRMHFKMVETTRNIRNGQTERLTIQLMDSFRRDLGALACLKTETHDHLMLNSFEKLTWYGVHHS